MNFVRVAPSSLVAIVLAAALAVAGTPAAASAAPAVREHARVQQMYELLMCTVCHESLAVAQSPESYEERALVRQLVAKGLTVKQVENEMVAQYGPQVLAEPPKHGFGLLVYIIPPVVVLIGVAILLYTIPRWRRRAAAARADAGAPGNAAPALTEQESQRLERELAERL